MKLSNIELPSNRKFGFFFSGVFFAVSAYFKFVESTEGSYLFVTLGVLFLIVTLVKADALLPLNKLWMRFGLLLGMIVGPIIMGVIFFGLFTPISMVMRLFGRDELTLRFKKKSTHWILRESPSVRSEAFKHQF